MFATLSNARSTTGAFARSLALYATLGVALVALAAPAPADPGHADPGRDEADGETREDDRLRVYDEVDVRERSDDLVGIAVSASEGVVGARELALRPIDRPGAVIESVPGVVATQHSGGGKANQFFLRGFNLDHGTDASISVAGVPVNMPSHGHGQGYADLNFLIPELVDHLHFRKGPYWAAAGDFSAAGSAEIDLLRRLSGRMLELTGGQNDFGRLLYAESFPWGAEADEGGARTGSGGDWLVAVDAFHEDGPWTRGNDYDGVKAVVRRSRGDAYRGSSLTLMAYDADWLSTDQVPLRAVESGQIGRFDAIDLGPRGDTERFSLSYRGHRGDADTWTEWTAFLMRYDFGLVSNFTYFLEDPVGGDQFEQADSRWVAGGSIDRRMASEWKGRRLEHRIGFDLRFDAIDNGLYRTTDLRRTATVREDSIEQFGGGPYAETTIHLADWLRVRAGVRLEGYLAEVDSDLELNSDRADDFLASPKLSWVFGPWRNTDVTLNYGRGFHSNDARGATLRIDPTTGDAADRVEPLVAAEGFDIGVRSSAIPGLLTTLTAFQLDLDSELVFVGDGGSTEASRPSRRRGIEWSQTYRPTRRLGFELDITLTDSEFTDAAPEGSEIPGAVGRTVAAAIQVEDLGPIYGELRHRSFGDVPLVEDGSAEWSESSRLDAKIGWHLRPEWTLELDLFNLLDSDDSDIEYFYASRLRGEPIGGVEDIHFHPLEERSARLTVIWRP